MGNLFLLLIRQSQTILMVHPGHPDCFGSGATNCSSGGCQSCCALYLSFTGCPETRLCTSSYNSRDDCSLTYSLPSWRAFWGSSLVKSFALDSFDSAYLPSVNAAPFALLQRLPIIEPPTNPFCKLLTFYKDVCYILYSTNIFHAAASNRSPSLH